VDDLIGARASAKLSLMGTMFFAAKFPSNDLVCAKVALDKIDKEAAREALIYSEGWDRPVKKASGKAWIRSNSQLLQKFATPLAVFFHGRVRPHELISASLARELYLETS
jgi:hypothetical protein